LEVGAEAIRVSAVTSERLACDASVVRIDHGADGTPLGVGRKTRTIPSAIRRARYARDTTCRFPACAARRCDAHHVVHWAEGGVTRLDNLVLLCRRHHRAVHEGRFTIARGHDDSVVVQRPDGQTLDVAPRLHWHGDPDGGHTRAPAHPLDATSRPGVTLD
jgi:hypothetical protein